MQLPHTGVERVDDTAPVLLDQLVDVALEAPLRPATLVVPSRHRLGVVGDLDKVAAPEPEHLSALTADGGDEQRVCPPCETRERRKAQVAADSDAIRHRVGQRQRAPEVVEARREDRDPAQAAPVESVVEPRLDPSDVALQGLARLAAQRALPLLERAARLGDQRVRPRLDAGRGRRLPRIEVQVEADGVSLVGLEACQFAKVVPRDGHCHWRLPCPSTPILAIHHTRPTDRRAHCAPAAGNVPPT